MENQVPQRGLWLIGTVLLVLAVYSPQLGAPFELQDDHRIVDGVNSRQSVGPRLAALIAEDFTAVGRFRPITHVIEVVAPEVFGADPFFWHLSLLLLAGTVTATLFAASWELSHSLVAAAIFASVTMLAPDPGPTAAWYRLGPKESWGMLFVAIAILAIVRAAARRDSSKDGIALLALALVAGVKESFVLLAPALFLFRVGCESHFSTRPFLPALGKLRFLGICYGVIFVAGCAGIAAALYGSGEQSYGGTSLGRGSHALSVALIDAARRMPSMAGWFVAPAIVVWASINRRVKLRWNAGYVLALFAWVVPQLILYASRGGFWDHYWLPCVVALSALNAFGFAALRRLPGPVPRTFAVLMAGVWIVHAMRVDIGAVVNFKERAIAQQQVIAITAESSRPDRDLVVVADELVEGERAHAVGSFSRAAGAKWRRLLVYDPVYAATSLMDPGGARRVVLSAEAPDAGAVVYLSGRSVLPPTWFRARDFTSADVTRAQRHLSLRRMGLARELFTIPVDLRTGTAAPRDALIDHAKR